MPSDWTLAWAPDEVQLAHGLRKAINGTTANEFPFTILDRRPSVQASSFPAEVVTCRLSDGSSVELLCKYGVGHVESGFGHRGGVPYESRVYREMLAPLAVSAVRYWGGYTDSDSSWIILEFLPDAARLDKTIDPFLWLVEAARWIGDLQCRYERFPHRNAAFLTRYTPGYFAGWAERTSKYTRSWHESFPWLSELFQAYSERGGMISESQLTLIHGEYYPKNILIDHGKVLPVDWESAAVAPGEIDLASLTEGNWPQDVVDACIEAYVTTRWPYEVPIDFASNLRAARLYLHLRWLGDNEAWTLQLATAERLSAVRELGEQLGLI